MKPSTKSKQDQLSATRRSLLSIYIGAIADKAA